MSDYRIVFNEQSGHFRVERRGWAGWSFVVTEGGGDYLTFDSLEAARRFVCSRRPNRRDSGRRWRVVDLCDGDPT